jgi:hypothetical protein
MRSIFAPVMGVSVTDQPSPEHLANRETLDELKASLAATHELGPDMQEHVLESFLTRLETRIDQRVDSRVGRGRTKAPSRREDPTGFAAATMGTAIPLVVLAGIFGGSMAIIAVVALVLIINLMYMVERLRRD